MSNPTPQNRIFRYADFTFPEPGAAFSTEQVQTHLASIYPEIAHATMTEKILPDGTVEITFRKQVASKGCGTTPLTQLIVDLGKMPALATLLADRLATLGTTPTLQALLPYHTLLDVYHDQNQFTHQRLREICKACLQIPPTPPPYLPLGF